MRKMYISSIKDRDQVDEVFLVKEKITAMAKNGKPYLTLRLMDKSGEVDAKIWDTVDEIGALFERNDFIAVRAKRRNSRRSASTIAAIPGRRTFTMTDLPSVSVAA